MVVNVTFNNISAIWWRLVSLAEETGVRGENHRPDASHWQTLSHTIVSRTPRHQRYLNSQIAIIVFKQSLNYHERSNVTTIFSKIMANIYLQVQWLIGMLDASGFLAPLQGNVQQKHNACSYLSSGRYNPISRPATEEEKTLIQQHLGVTTNDVTVYHYAKVGSSTYIGTLLKRKESRENRPTLLRSMTQCVLSCILWVLRSTLSSMK